MSRSPDHARLSGPQDHAQTGAAWSARPCHVAILKKPFLDAVLAGRKTVESRLMKKPVPPWDCCEAGDAIFFKESGGRFRAFAHADRVLQFQDLRPAEVLSLGERWDHLVRGGDAYWRSRRESAFAVLIGLRLVSPLPIGPDYPRSPWRAWHVVRASTDAVRPADRLVLDSRVTRGAIQNRYVLLPARRELLTEAAFRLQMPDGRDVRTDAYRGARIRWRGWGEYFDRHAVRPGDVVRFVRIGEARYRVFFVASTRLSAPAIHSPQRPA